MRLSEWSSDVCSSDLRYRLPAARFAAGRQRPVALREAPDRRLAAQGVPRARFLIRRPACRPPRPAQTARTPGAMLFRLSIATAFADSPTPTGSEIPASHATLYPLAPARLGLDELVPGVNNREARRRGNECGRPGKT